MRQIVTCPAHRAPEDAEQMRNEQVRVGSRYRLADSVWFGLHAGQAGLIVAVVRRRGRTAFLWECAHGKHDLVVRGSDLQDGSPAD